ncbi:MAG: hypothetical protein JWM55_1668 [Acidimicrobiaceae bacterium]|nr:hypothetical protein [Acidimicrobiaceae bacterium]
MNMPVADAFFSKRRLEANRNSTHGDPGALIVDVRRAGGANLVAFGTSPKELTNHG